MELQRPLLLGAIALLAFMLLTEWVSFRDQHDRNRTVDPGAAITDTATNPAAEYQGEPSALQMEQGQFPATNSTADSDVPVLEVTAAPSLAAESSIGSDNLVTVVSDVLEVSIDLVGGDIVDVALPTVSARLDTPDVPFQLLQRSSQLQYYAQSGLIGKNATDSRSGRPRFSVNRNHFELAASEQELVVDLEFVQQDGVEITKRFTFSRGEFLIGVEYLVNNTSAETWRANLFTQIKRDGSPDPAAASGGMGLAPYLGGALSEPDKRFRKISFDDMEDEPYRATLPGGWIAMIQHYFLSAWVADPSMEHEFSTAVTRSGEYIIRFTSPETVVSTGETASITTAFYAGPKDQYRLEEIAPGLDLSVDYSWLWWIAKPLFWLLTEIHKLVGNWGVAIILLTVVVKAAFFQLSAKSFKSMANMRRVQPKIVDLKERYADDKQKQSQAMMELYKKEKINPLGGCLPILIQMPVFISLYWVLMESVELRHAPFALWIHDLSVMDPYFVLPLIMGASMWFQQRLNPPPPDPMQAKIMQWMPIVFTFFFLFFPAGLVLYWVVNNLLSITQQWIITRAIDKAAA